jgi:plasmid stabilization system protein ParE
MNVRIRIEAEADLEGAFDWYESRRTNLGRELLDEFLLAVEAIAQSPQRWPAHPVLPEIRRYRLKRFPFALAYKIERDYCMIFAVEHLQRKPGYWRGRL